MERSDRIRIYGARKRHFYFIIVILFALTIVYCLDFGISKNVPIFLPFVLVFSVEELIRTRKIRRLNRVLQIGNEVLTRNPNASVDTLCDEYTARRHRELRIEAGLFLLYDVALIPLFLLLWYIDAPQISYGEFAMGFFLALLAVSAVLLIVSFLPRKRGDEEAYFRSFGPGTDAKPDHRSEDPIHGMTAILYRTKAAPSREDLAIKTSGVLQYYKRISILTFVGLLCLPAALFLTVLLFNIISDAGPDQLYMVITMFFCLLAGLLGWLAIPIVSSAYGKGLFADLRRIKDLREGKYSLEYDRVESVSRHGSDQYRMEICFEKKGHYIVYQPGIAANNKSVEINMQRLQGNAILLTLDSDSAPFLFVYDDEEPEAEM